jgi:hypothetical protein
MPRMIGPVPDVFDRIEADNWQELKCWAEIFGTSPAAVRAAVDAVGPMVSAVSRHLGALAGRPRGAPIRLDDGERLACSASHQGSEISTGPVTECWCAARHALTGLPTRSGEGLPSMRSMPPPSNLRSYIDRQDPQELLHWARMFGITSSELLTAIQGTGGHAGSVAIRLSRAPDLEMLAAPRSVMHEPLMGGHSER